MLTARLALRPLVPGDAAAVLALFSRPEVARWSGDGRVLASMEEARRKVGRYAERGGDRPGLGVLAVRRRAAPEEPLVGVVLLVPLPPSEAVERDDVEVGWHLHPDVWGQGIATEAASALLQHAWRLGLGQVHAVTHPENAASQAVCHRLAMADLGLREDWYDRRLRAFAAQRP
ncbi:GNAT family N-acetyltransferase [Aeromicrobium halocynthiae]|uniref:GNAT family N-acetyltransferase n=2 Tax=Aeromicrobium halocynthiae TaxID=560557 RepID=A0ABN2W3W3_9ACTN